MGGSVGNTARRRCLELFFVYPVIGVQKDRDIIDKQYKSCAKFPLVTSSKMNAWIPG
jgi:hypothetical protein